MDRGYVELLLKNPDTQKRVLRLEKIKPLTCHSVDKANPIVIKQIAYVQVTFKETSGTSVTKLLGFCIIPNSAESMIIGKPTLDALGFMSNRHSIELADLELRFPTILPANLTDEHGTFLHLDQNLNLSGSPQGCRQHRIQVSVPKKMAGQHLWIEQGPGCPECVEVIEGPVHIPEGSRGKAPVDELVGQDVRVGPRNVRHVQSAPNDAAWREGPG